MSVIPQDFRLGMLDVYLNGDLIVWQQGRLFALDSGTVEAEHFAIVEAALRKCDGNLEAARLGGKPVTLDNEPWLKWLDHTCTKIRPMTAHWEQFWHTLDTVRCWDWLANYRLPGEFENRPGLMWWVEIQRGDQVLRSAGWNAVPPAFDEFCKAVIALSGRKFLLPDYNPRGAARR